MWQQLDADVATATWAFSLGLLEPEPTFLLLHKLVLKLFAGLPNHLHYFVANLIWTVGGKKRANGRLRVWLPW